MKQKQWMLLMCALALSMLLSACGSAPKTVASSMAATAVPAAPPQSDAVIQEIAQETDSMTLASDAPALPQNRKIILHSSLSLETMEFDKALTEVTALITAQGGYVESQTVDGRSMRRGNDYYERSASINARVPAQNLTALTTSIGTLCNITSRNDSSEDITDSYFDTQAHLETLAVREERLLEILKKAQKLEEVITLEKALADVRYEIETLTASIKRMDSAVDFSYLNLNLHEVAQYEPSVNAPRTFGDKLSLSLTASTQHLVSTVQGIILVVIELLPVMLLWTAIIGGIVWLVLRLRRAKGVKAAKRIQEPKATEEKK